MWLSASGKPLYEKAHFRQKVFAMKPNLAIESLSLLMYSIDVSLVRPSGRSTKIENGSILPAVPTAPPEGQRHCLLTSAFALLRYLPMRLIRFFPA